MPTDLLARPRPVIGPIVRPTADDATRREFLAGLTAAGLLAACGDTDDGADEPVADGYPRDVEHTDGITTVPTRPERIVVLDPLAELEAVLALGLAPVQIGVNTDEDLGAWLEAALDDLEADPERVSADMPADPEVVARARPDLIVGRAFWVEEARPQLEQLAPTLVLDADVLANITILGEAAGLEERAAEILAEYEARLVAEVDGSVPAGTPVAIVRYEGEGTFSSYDQPGYGPVDLLHRAGFTATPGLAGSPDEFSLDLSLEELGRLAPAELVVVLAFSPEPTAELLENPLFAGLPAVAAGRLLVIERGPVTSALANLGPLKLDVALPLVGDASALLR